MNNRLPTNPEQPSQPQVTGHPVRAWKDKDAQRKLAQLQNKLHEFREQLMKAQASVLLKTAEEYREKQGKMFATQVEALDLVSTILDIAQAGVILTPNGWQNGHV